MAPRTTRPTVLGLGLLALVAACVKTPADYQREQAQALRPTAHDTVPVLPPEARPPRTVYRVRILADDDYQAQVGRWGAYTSGQVARASRILEAQLGVRLEAEEARAWSHGGGSPDLDQALRALMAAEPGDGVDFVVGFVGRSPGLVAAKEMLGMAHLGGRHLLVRAMPNFEEAQAVARAFDKLSASEQDRLVRERQQHRETAVLLHEWGHLLGAEHDPSSEWIMSPMYEPAQHAFSPESLARVAAGLARLSGPARPAASPALAPAPAPSPPVVAAPAAPPLPAKERALLDEVRALERKGDLAAASRRLAPLAARRLDDPRVQDLSCSLALRRAPGARPTADACELAAQLEGAHPVVLLGTADLRLRRNRRAEVHPLLLRAEGRIEAAARPELWADLAHLYDRAGICSGAERAAQRAADPALGRDVQAECTRRRRALALPRGNGAVPEAREREYAERMEAVQEAVQRHAPEQAAERRRELARAFPGAPGLALADCLIAADGKDAARALDACGRAVAADGEATQAHFERGLAAGKLGDWEAARTHLRRALALDDSYDTPWMELARAHQELGETQDLAALGARYRRRFGGELPKPGPREP